MRRHKIIVVGILGLVVGVGSVRAFWNEPAPETSILNSRYGQFEIAGEAKTLRAALGAARGPEPYGKANIEIAWPRSELGSNYDAQVSRLKREADAHARTECGLLLDTLAATCTVTRTQIGGYRDVMSLTVHLQFLPSGNPLNGPGDGSLRAIRTLSFSHSDRSSKTSAQARAARRGIYARVNEDCRSARYIYGGCLVLDLDVDSRGMGPDESRRINVQAKASIGVPQRAVFVR